MAANVTGMRVEGTVVTEATEKRGGVHRRRIGIVGLLAAILVAAVIGWAAMHARSPSSLALPAIPRVTTGAETRFLEENTITLPSAVGSDSLVITAEEQRFLEMNTTWMPAVADVPSPVITAEEQRFLEANTVLPQSFAQTYMEDLTPANASTPR